MSPPVARIDDHGLVGDLRTTALISSAGTIDSLCLPDADSPSVFAALLDGAGGHLTIDLVDIPDGEDVRRRQHYLPNTNILMTRLEGAGAIAQIRDFMLPVHLADDRVGVLVRQVTALHGARSIHLSCWPGFDYARADHRATLSDDRRTVDFTSDTGGLRLHSSHEIQLTGRERGPEATVDVSLQPGQVATLVLEWVAGDDAPAEAAEQTIGRVDGWAHATEHYWHSWIDSTTYDGGWADPVRRSALCLKLLQHKPTGGIVAAPTFGLPEWPGAERNWDYRYVWLRDAAFVIFAFLRIGFVDEATQFTDWLARRCVDMDDGNGLRPVYRLDGTPPDDETELGHLSGYADSRPVRIGNAAYQQVQLDVLGEVMDGLYLFDRVRPISWDLWLVLGVQLDWLAEHWEQPDSGIWEVRGERQQFVSSKLLVWVAFERALRLARRRGLPGDRDKWQAAADAAYRWVQENGWDADLGAYVQRAGATDLDASALLIPMLRFASGTDPRVLATLDAIGDQLSTDSMLYRYRAPGSPGGPTDPDASGDAGEPGESGRSGESGSDEDDAVDSGGGALDGVGGAEGTFTVCTFWYVENLARAGRLHEARLTFEKVLTYANELGLFSEQIGPAGEALGNFPQALTHLGLISAATTLDGALRSGGRA